MQQITLKDCYYMKNCDSNDTKDCSVLGNGDGGFHCVGRRGGVA